MVEALQMNMALPTRAMHLWKYTKPEALLSGISPVAADGWSGVSVTLPQIAKEAGVTVYHVALGSFETPPFGSVVDGTHGYFEAMNSRLCTGGVLVQVPDGVTLDQPIEIVVSRPAAEGFVRVFVQIGKGASAQLIERCQGRINSGTQLVVTEILLGERASLHHGVAVDVPQGALLHHTVRTELSTEAVYRGATVATGRGLYKGDVGAILAGERSDSDLRSFVAAPGGASMDLHTVHDHQSPRSRSSLLFRSVVAAEGTSVCTGRIRIDAAAKEAQATQEARNILLSEKAQAFSIPELEILNNDVACSHGATTSTIDPEQIFYLESRGLSTQQATRLILEGGVQKVLEVLPASMRDVLEKTFIDALEGVV